MASVHHRRGCDPRLAYGVQPLYVFATTLRALAVDALVRDDLTTGSLLPGP